MEPSIDLERKVIIDYYNELISEVNNIKYAKLVNSYITGLKDNVSLLLIIRSLSGSKIFSKLLYSQILELGKDKKYILSRYEDLDWKVLFRRHRLHHIISKDFLQIKSTVVNGSTYFLLNESCDIIWKLGGV